MTIMDKLWKSKTTTTTTNIKIFDSVLKAVLLYTSEFWTITQVAIVRQITVATLPLQSIEK